ncbi:MAG: glycosyltransferase [Cyclobacteriaceae bacterium]|nr:glycosyltransferase [Cyclobacteriaceae bacterium]
MTGIFTVILSFYCILLIVLLVGWILVRRQSISLNKVATPGISIVLAARNETNLIENIITDFSRIAYPSDKFEAIIVNDHSTDDTVLRAEQLTKNFSNIRILHLPQGKEGKKQALTFGIENSSFEIIAATDADCRISKNWLRCIASHFETDETKMVIGAVKLTAGKSFFKRLQVMEFISLVGSTASTIGLGHPIMCNGANLAFRKDTFKEVKGYEGNLQIASGDDEFLMRKIFKRYPTGIKFLNFYEAVVSSLPQESISGFFQQRLRWAGKWKHNSDLVTQAIAVLILLAQISFIGLIIRNLNSVDATVVLIGVKLFLEGTMIFWTGRFLERRFDVLAFAALQILYPVYVVVIGIASLMISYRWKNRNYK